jgi:hypothetical protein
MGTACACVCACVRVCVGEGRWDEIKPTIPDYAYDKHTRQGQAMVRCDAFNIRLIVATDSSKWR